jgi:hypothetical protein
LTEIAVPVPPQLPWVVCPLLLQPPLISPPTNKHSPARPAGLAPRNSLSAKFICMGFPKNDPHATKMKNHFVYIFLIEGSF